MVLWWTPATPETIQGETLVPIREELHFTHDVLDPDEIFIPKVKK